MRMQCVQFARSWLSRNLGLIYDEVDIAADIWDKIGFYTRHADGHRIPVTNILNGSLRPPGFGDLLVYGERFMATGHVAVVTGIDLPAGLVDVREQNYANRYQPPDHVRRIPLIRNQTRYWLLDH